MSEAKPDKAPPAIFAWLVHMLTASKDYGHWLPALTLVWAVSTCPLLWIGWSAEARRALQGMSIASASTLLGWVCCALSGEMSSPRAPGKSPETIREGGRRSIRLQVSGLKQESCP